MTRDRPDGTSEERPMRVHDVRGRVRYASHREQDAPHEAEPRRYVAAKLSVGFTVSRPLGSAIEATWYDTRRGKVLYWGTLLATLLGVGLSATYVEMRVPPAVYLFGFLGATVYVFTSFAKRFGEADRYRLKVLSRTVAVLPLAAGVYLLAFAFPGVSGELSVLDPSTGETTVSSGDRVVAGLVFLAGVYVSAALRALGGLAERLLGIAPSRSTEATDATPSGNGRVDTD